MRLFALVFGYMQRWLYKASHIPFPYKLQSTVDVISFFKLLHRISCSITEHNFCVLTVLEVAHSPGGYLLWWDTQGYYAIFLGILFAQKF